MKNKGYAKFLVGAERGANKAHYDKCGSGVLANFFSLPSKRVCIYFFQKQEYIVMIFSTFLGSNQKYTTKSVCRAYENFFKATRLVLHITCEKCLD